MRRIAIFLVVMGCSGPVRADDCKIVWWDIFLPQSDAKFEMTSGASAKLTLINTGRVEPIHFDLALRRLRGADGQEMELLFGMQTLVLGGVSNDVTVTLQPKANSWLVGFANKQIIRTTKGKTFDGETMLGGSLYCD